MKSKRASVILLIVIGLLVFTLGIPLVREMRALQDQAAAQNHLKLCVLALRTLNDAQETLPPAFDAFADIKYPASMHVHMLPYVKREPLFKQFLDKDAGDREAFVQAYFAPTDASITSAKLRKGVQNFAGNLRVFTFKGLETDWDKDMPALKPVEPGGDAIDKIFLDGTSNSIIQATKLAVCGDGGSQFTADPTSPFAAFFGQNAARKRASPSDPGATFQVTPYRSGCITSPLMAQSLTSRGLLAGFADGSNRILVAEQDPNVWNRMVQPNDSREFQPQAKPRPASKK